jgi:hypothetical protein
MRCHHQRHRWRQAGSTRPCGPIVRVRRNRSEPGGSPGKPEMLTYGTQLEQPEEGRQSSVVDIGGGLRQEVR